MLAVRKGVWLVLSVREDKVREGVRERQREWRFRGQEVRGSEALKKPTTKRQSCLRQQHGSC